MKTIKSLLACLVFSASLCLCYGCGSQEKTPEPIDPKDIKIVPVET